jgi:hypothetical protein
LHAGFPIGCFEHLVAGSREQRAQQAA